MKWFKKQEPLIHLDENGGTLSEPIYGYHDYLDINNSHTREPMVPCQTLLLLKENPVISHPMGARMGSLSHTTRNGEVNIQDAFKRCEEDIWIFHLLDEWARDNEYITDGYRAFGKNPFFYLISLFWFHNETINIWIHLIGLFLTIAFQYYYAYGTSYLYYWSDQVCFHVFCLAMELCYLFSVIMHTFYPISERVSHTLQRIDYVGISLLMMGNVSVFVYFSFYGDYVLQQTYYFLLIGAEVLAIPFMVTKWFVRHRNVRGGFFTFYTLVLTTPVIHRLIFTQSLDDHIFRILEYFAFGTLFYAIGGVFYVSRFPERLRPGNFNYIGSSHQWFHLFSVLAGCIMCWTFTQLQYQGTHGFT